MKAITFLGTGNYKKTIYTFKDEEAQPTELFPKALCELFELEELLVVVTKCAKKEWFAKLEEQLKESGIKITEVPIPDGHSEEDLWTIFDEITKFLDEGDELIFDITHSFRTVPLLSFLAANYLQTAKNVKIKGIY
jgi:CRISPR-associated DxTHG motif protein